jgi:hypothetical protein
MTDKLRNTDGMLFDIYQEDLHLLPIVRSIYAEINDNASKKMIGVSAGDIPLLKYVALMYDKNSPIKRESMDRRKSIACEQAKFKNNKELEDAVFIKNDRVVGFIHYYLRFLDDHTWTSYILNSEVFHQNAQIVLKGASDPKEQQTVMALMKSNEELRVRIKSYEDEIFGDNKEKMKEIISFYVEDFVDELEKAAKDVQTT